LFIRASLEAGGGAVFLKPKEGLMRRFVLAAVGLAALAATTAPAEAGQQIGSSLTIKIEPGMSSWSFSGKVGSPKDACKAHRIVQVFQKQGGEKERIGKDETNRDGKWKTVEPPPSGHRFFAKVKRKEVDAGTCLAVQTDTVNLNL
jgi:hypothetical protein